MKEQFNTDSEKESIRNLENNELNSSNKYIQLKLDPQTRSSERKKYKSLKLMMKYHIQTISTTIKIIVNKTTRHNSQTTFMKHWYT